MTGLLLGTMLVSSSRPWSQAGYIGHQNCTRHDSNCSCNSMRLPVSSCSKAVRCMVLLSFCSCWLLKPCHFCYPSPVLCLTCCWSGAFMLGRNRALSGTGVVPDIAASAAVKVGDCPSPDATKLRGLCSFFCSCCCWLAEGGPFSLLRCPNSSSQNSCASSFERSFHSGCSGGPFSFTCNLDILKHCTSGG